MSSPSRLLLLLDFDGTITTSDTTHDIMLAALQTNPSLTAADTPFSVTDATKWCSDMYARDSRRLSDSISGSGGLLAVSDPHRVADPHSPIHTLPPRLQGRVHNLDATQPVERRSFLRVRAAALGTAEPHCSVIMPDARRQASRSCNATRPDDWQARMREAGATAVREGRVHVRDVAGLRALLKWVHQTPDADWRIVSVSFSREFIVGALVQADLVPESIPAVERAGYVRRRVCCNEVLGDGGPDIDVDVDGLTPLHSVGDKLGVCLREARGYGLDRRDVVMVYVGDSPTDLACLAAADVGVVMRDENVGAGRDKLREDVLEYLGACPKILSNRSAWEGEMIPKLCWSSTFRDIHDHLHWVMEDRAVA